MLHVFEFLPSGLALLDGEANSSSYKTQLGRSRGLPLSSTRRQSASPSHASQSACWFGGGGGGGGCFRLRVVAGCGVGAVDGVSSESFEGGAGKRMGGREGAESQEEVVDGNRIG